MTSPGALIAAAAASSLLLLAPSSSTSYAPGAVPRIAVSPASTGPGGTVQIQIEMPPRAGKPSVRAFLGSLGALKNDGGVWTTTWAPPAGTAPAWDVIAAEGPGGTTGVAVVTLIGRTRLPVPVSKAVSEATVTVGSKTFGPVTPDLEGTAEIEVDLPPGVREVKVEAIVPGLKPIVTTEPLALPPQRRVFVQGPSKGKAGKALAVTVIAIDRAGGVSMDEPKVKLEGPGASGANLKRVSAIGPGVWRIDVVPAAAGGNLVVGVRAAGTRGRLAVAVPTVKRPDAGATVTESGSGAETGADTGAGTGTGTATAPVIAGIPPAPSCEELREAPGEVTTAARLKARIDEALREQDLVRRRDQLTALTCRFPDEHLVRLQLVAVWLLLGDDRSALDAVQPLLATEDELHDEHRALGLSYRATASLRTGAFDDAIADARAAESLLPGLYSATYTLGEAYYLKKQFPDALAALLSAYRAAPGYASSVDHAMLARLLEARGDLDDAAWHRLSAARLEPNDASGWREAARVAESAGKWARAHEAWTMLAASALPGVGASAESHAGCARAAIAAARDPEIAAFEAAMAAERAGDTKKAIAALERVMVVNKDNTAARWHLARSLAAAGPVDRAAAEIGIVLAKAPKWAPALILSGDLEKRRGDAAKARMRYREAATLDPAAPMSVVAKWRLAELERVDR